jgi:hypothetical protein
MSIVDNLTLDQRPVKVITKNILQIILENVKSWCLHALGTKTYILFIPPFIRCS